MNIKQLSILSAFVFLFFACGDTNHEATEETHEGHDATEETATADVSYNLSTETSNVTWKGSMMGMYAHEGNVKLSEGTLTANAGNITGGSVTIDLSTIEPTDNNYPEDKPKEKLVGHLSSPDFFDIKEFPTATFVITSAEGTTITGDLTIKGKTNSETVTDVTVAEENGNITASGNLKFDRQKYGVSYQVTMKDMVISDEIELSISLSGSAATL